jgi:hypothetical protein
MPRTIPTINHPTYSAPAMRAFLDMRANIAARLRAANRIATKGGFARTNGGYICRNSCAELSFDPGEVARRECTARTRFEVLLEARRGAFVRKLQRHHD